MLEPKPRTWWQRWLAWLSEVGGHDFCPWANHYVYWLKQPIGWFVIAAAGSLLVGLFLGPQGYVLLAAILSVIALGVIWPWLAMRGLSCELRFDRRAAEEGDRVRAILTVSNRWFMPAWGIAVSRGMTRQELEHRVFVSLGVVWPWSRTEFEWDFYPERRGVYPLTTPQFATGFPFGIWECRRWVVVKSFLTVWPRHLALSEWPAQNGWVRSMLGAETRRAGNQGDTLGLRPYRHGDSYRDVHWPQTARQGELIVRERHSVSRREALVVIDAETAHHAGSDGDHSFEWALRAAATLVRELHRRWFLVECRCGELKAALPIQAPCLGPVLDRLATVELIENGSGRPSNFMAADGGVGNGRAPRLMFVIATNRSFWCSEPLADGVYRIVIDADLCQARAGEFADDPLRVHRVAAPLQCSWHFTRASVHSQKHGHGEVPFSVHHTEIDHAFGAA